MSTLVPATGFLPAGFAAIAPWIVAAGVAAVACVSDVARRRIPNVLTFTAAVVALAFHGSVDGLGGAGIAVGGWALGLALFMPMFLLGGMGAGDVKLLAALGAWLGPGNVLWVALYAAIAGGVFAVALALTTGYLSQMLRNVWLLLTHWRVGGVRRFEPLTLQGGCGPRLAYALPIAVGVLCAMWLR